MKIADIFDAFRLALALGAATLGIGAAVLNLWAGAQTKVEQSAAQNSFKAILNAIERSRWSDLPGMTITYGLYPFVWLGFAPLNIGLLYAPLYSIAAPLVWAATEALVPRPSASTGTYLVMSLAALIAVCASVRLSRHLYAWGLSPLRRITVFNNAAGGTKVLLQLLLLCYYGRAAINWWHILPYAPYGLSLTLGLLLVPAVGSIFVFVSGFYLQIAGRLKTARVIPWRTILPGFAAGMGVMLTLGALLFGHVLNPGAATPRAKQILAANLLFDAITVVITLRAFSRAVDPEKVVNFSALHDGFRADNSKDSVPLGHKEMAAARLEGRSPLDLHVHILVDDVLAVEAGKRRWPVSAAVVLAVVVGSACAVLSIWTGLIGTKQQVSIPEAIHVFCGRSVNGAHWEFGPYFWAMHTTFLPLVLYCLAVLFAAGGKLLLRPTQWLFARASHPDVNAIGLAARTVAVMAAVIGLFALGVDLLKRLIL